MKTKTVLILLGTAAAGGAIWYFHAKKIADASKAFVDYVQKGSYSEPEELISPRIPNPLLTTKPLILTTTQTQKPATTVTPIQSPVSKVYPTISQTPYSQPVLTKENYLAMRELSLRGALL